MIGHNTRGAFHLLVGAVLTVGTLVIGSLLTSSLTGKQTWGSLPVWLAVGVVVTFFYLRGSPQLLVNQDSLSTGEVILLV